MIRCIAIDDEPLALKQLQSYIEKIPYLELVTLCRSALEAQSVLSKTNIDVLFCDINMPDLSGLDFVKSLVNPPYIVFTTAYSEYAVEGYKVNAVGYLLKPFGFDEFKSVAEKVRSLIEKKSHNPGIVDGDNNVFFKSDYKAVRVNINKIVYIEGMSEYLKIHIEDEDPIVVLFSMKKIEDNLPSDKFMRIHKSYIVNLSRIREVSKNRVELGKDISIPIGDSYRSQLNTFIDSKFFGK